jgi:acetyl-CoA acyltransferase 1
MSSPQQRLNSVANQLAPGSARQKILAKNPDDVVCYCFAALHNSLRLGLILINWQVITYLTRTPLTKARKGGLKDTTVDDLLISLLTVFFFSPIGNKSQ